MKKFILLSIVFILHSIPSSSAQLFCTSNTIMKVADKIIISLSYNPTLKILAYVSDDEYNRNRSWSTKITLGKVNEKQKTLKLLQTVHVPFLTSLTWNPKQNTFATSSLNELTMWQFDKTKKKIIPHDPLEKGQFLNICWHPQKPHIFACSRMDKEINVILNHEQKKTFSITDNAHCMSWDSSGRIIAYTNPYANQENNKICMVKFTEDLTQIQSIKDFTFNETVTHLAWHPQYPILACSHNNTTLSIYHFDYKNNQLTLLKTINKDFETITAITWHTNKLTLFIAEGMQTLRVLEFLYYPKNYFETVPTHYSDTIITYDSNKL